MNKNIFLIVFALFSFTITAQAQSCCSSKSDKEKSSCSKKSSTEAESATDEAKGTAVIATEEVAAKEVAAKEVVAKGVVAKEVVAKGVAVIAAEEVSATDKTEVFTVYGNCGMCKRTIEGSLKGVEGVTLAGWNKETAQMTVSYNEELISLDAIKQKIADVGYDSDTHRATEEVYNNLHGCCQYERPSE